MYLLGKSNSYSADLLANWSDKSNVEQLHTLGRVKTYLFQNFDNPRIAHSISEWLSETHYLEYRNSMKYQSIKERSKFKYDPDLLKLRLIHKWKRDDADRFYFTLIRFTSDSGIDFLQSKLGTFMKDPQFKPYGLEEIYFFTGYDIPSVYTMLLGWDSLTSFENRKNQLSTQLQEYSFLKLDFSHTYQLKLVYKWVK